MKAPAQHIIIDGYNVIHSMPNVKEWMNKNMDVAREALFNMAKALHDSGNARVTIVFDGKEEAIQIERPTKEDTLSVVFAPASLSADGLIEQLVAKSKQPDYITAVTRDNMIQETLSSLGAHSMDPEEWFIEIERATKHTSQRVRHRSQEIENEWGKANRLHFPPKRKK